MPSDKIRRSLCPVTFSLNMFGDKWSLLIVRDLVFRGATSYGEFMNSGEGISTNILADRLKKLESSNIIDKSIDPQNRKKYLYALTTKGLDLVPILIEMVCWGGKHDPDTSITQELIARLKTEPEVVINEIKELFLNGPS